MATFVLVHGGFHGGWCWSRVVPLLREAGHEVLTPTLTGLGERSHLARPDVDLSTHVTDIANVLRFEELSDVVLVGHSYAGMVISGVAAVAREQLAALVHLDAACPVEGESLADIHPAGSAFREAAEVAGEGWLVPVPDRDFGLQGADLARLIRLMTPQPLATFEQPVRTLDTLDHVLPRWVVHCTEGLSPEMAARHDPAKAAGRYVELLGPHDIMISHAGPVAEILRNISGAVVTR